MDLSFAEVGVVLVTVGLVVFLFVLVFVLSLVLGFGNTSRLSRPPDKKWISILLARVTILVT